MMKRFVISLLLVLPWTVTQLHAQSAIAVDSTVYQAMREYYNKYLLDNTDPITLTKYDSLYRWAQQYRYVSMMSSAITAPLRYYYYADMEDPTDSIKAWTERVQTFAKDYGRTDVYFQAWSFYLVNNYIRRGEYTLALVEAQNMLEEAEKETDKSYILDCYTAMINIYSAKGLDDKAQEVRVKGIEVYEVNNLEAFAISLQYSDGALYFIKHNELPKAAEYIRKASETARTAYHRVTLKQTQVYYYLAIKDYSAAQKAFNESRQIIDTDETVRQHVSYQYSMEVDYFIAIKDYASALQSLEKERLEYEKNSESASLILLDKRQADLLWLMGREAESGEMYRKYVDEQRKQKEREEEVSTSEFATMLNLQKLSDEKRELEQLSQAEQLRNTRTIVGALVVLLLVVGVFLFYQRRINQNLKLSRDELDEKNHMLIETEEQLRAAKEEAERSSNMKTVFIQNMSHEIRTPLNSIVGLSAVLADLFADSEDEVKLYASLIDENSALLLKLIGDILDISALDDSAEIEMSAVDVNKCCRKAVDELQPFYAQKSLTLNFEPLPNEIVIRSNGDRIMQVLKNLLNNAAKFSSAGGTVVLDYALNEADHLISFSVTDTGVGIPVAEQERIFERFVKLDEFTQGTGLGLSICRIVAEKMGGTIRVDSSYTEGARFVFTIPTA
ncbi:MAG: hypothetical protein LBM61_02630 [Prevotellaceae bacterium]|jgi:signal transduction histidine kinase|nr:hypothetical protein [Prevotellaceae bacterium]